jgi:hypothetical protein
VRRIAFLLLLVAALVGCAKQASAPADSGIRGIATLGPLCPVERVGSPCPDRPMQAEIQVRDATSGDVVATVRSDADGHFTVDLPPGQYVLEGVPPTPGSPFPIAKPTDATVRPHRFTEVTVSFDTGIR